MSLRYSRSGSDNRPDDNRPADDQVTGDQVTGGPPSEEDRRSFTTGIGSMVGPEADDEATAHDETMADDETVPPRPTFTARPGGPVTAVPEPALAPDDAGRADSAGRGAPALGPDDGTELERTAPDVPALAPDDGAPTEPGVMPGAGPVAGSGPVPGPDLASADGDRAQSHPLPATAGLDEPLLGDAEGLRTRWQRVQAGFVDDPREAVGEAADLIEQTAQAMVGALRQRQRQLRVMWESGPEGGAAPANGGPAAGGADTEHLRQMMRHYRALFNQLCRP